MWENKPYPPFKSKVHPSELPHYYDIMGERRVAYSYAYGPHTGTVCLCPECLKINEVMAMSDSTSSTAYSSAWSKAIYNRAYQLVYEQMDRMALASMNDDIPMFSYSNGYMTSSRKWAEIMGAFASKEVDDVRKDLLQLIKSSQDLYCSEIARLEEALKEATTFAVKPSKLSCAHHKTEGGRKFKNVDKHITKEL